MKKQEKTGGSERNRTAVQGFAGPYITTLPPSLKKMTIITILFLVNYCLLYTSDAADEAKCVDLGGRRIIKKIF